MKIWALSDTHGTHRLINVPKVGMVIFAGDATNSYNLQENLIEFEDFFDWFVNLDIKYKVICAGNHDTWATKKYSHTRLKEKNVHYLEHEFIFLDGLTIFGSPFTPTFGTWNFMKDRSKLDEYWKEIPEAIDILVTHGPPQGILDLSRNKDHIIEFCGDKALLKHVKRVNPKYHIFGHLHDFEDCLNHGIRVIKDTTFINASSVEDGKRNQLKYHGIIFEI